MTDHPERVLFSLIGIVILIALAGITERRVFTALAFVAAALVIILLSYHL